MSVMQSPRIKPLGREDIASSAALLAFLNPDVPENVLAERIETIFADHPHYQLFGAFSEEEMVGLAGAWIATKIWCGRYLEIDNLVVHPGRRSSGAGTALIQHLEKMAREAECTTMVIDSYTANRQSHRLYFRLGFEIWSFHFIKPLT